MSVWLTRYVSGAHIRTGFEAEAEHQSTHPQQQTDTHHMEDMAEQPQEEFVNSVPAAAPVEEAADPFDAPPEDAPLEMGGEMPVGVNAAAPPPAPEDVFSSAPAAPADDFTTAAPQEGAPLPAMTFSQPSNALECVPLHPSHSPTSTLIAFSGLC